MSHASVAKPRPKPVAHKSRSHVASLRHRLLTPLNHIVGYSEMLLEDAPQSGYSSAGQHLKRIRETARELTRLIQTELVPRQGKPAERILAEMRSDIAAPLHTILQTVGSITSDSSAYPADEDVMKIGRAAAELLGMIHARAPYPGPTPVAPFGRSRRSAPAPKTQPGRILIVDDNKSNRELLARRLKRQGHHVTEASSGAEALELLVETPQDVVILDVLMPRLDGFQVLERIKADPALTEIPVIVVSALDEVPGVVRSIEMGAEDYLFKPIDPVLLAARIASSLEKKRLHDLERRRAADLEEAYQRIQLSEERLRLALKADRARIWEWDLASDRVLAEKERTFEESLATVHADDRERVRERLFRAVENRGDFHEEMRLLRRDGSSTWVESLAMLHFDSDGRPARMIGLTRDISRRKQTEDDLRRSNQEFQRFALAASHDLQEPLRAVSTDLASLARRLSGDEARAVAAAVDSLGRMSKLIGDLLDYSQMSPAPVRKQPVSAEAVLALVLADLRVPIESSGALITHDKLPAVRADFMLLHRVFQNLISNAIKYRGKDAPRIHVAARGDASQWTFSVADNGIGIDPKYGASIFGVFRRLHSRGVPGSGLGLAISKRIVERLGGKIWMESAPGQGSTFYFTLPN